MEYQKIASGKIGSARLIREIRKQANGSFYRTNAKSADCYAFSIDKIGMRYMDGTTCKREDFTGGWDWKNDLIDSNAEYILDFTDNKFYKVMEATE